MSTNQLALYLLNDLIYTFSETVSFSNCRFYSSRLSIQTWTLDKSLDLPSALLSILTPDVTEALPVNWRGKYDIDRCKSFIIERDIESPTLLIMEKETHQAIGLIIVFIVEDELKLGYLLKKDCWGKGYGTEVVRSFVSFCGKRFKQNIKYISAGCDIKNIASQKVLTKNGFKIDKEIGSDTEVFFRLTL